MYLDSAREPSIGELLIDATNLGTPSEDEVREYWRGKGVFVSSVINGYETERAAAIDAIESRAARPVAWERIVPAPVKVEHAWLSGVNSADALTVLLGHRYGLRRDDGRSATHSEFARAEERGIPRWAFLDSRAEGSRDALLQNWIDDDLTQRHSYAHFDSPDSLAARIAAKLDDEAAMHVFTWYKFGRAIIRGDSVSLSAPDLREFSSGSSGQLTARGTILDAEIRDYLGRARQNRDHHALVIDGQLFEATLDEFVETMERGRAGYEASFSLSPVRTRSSGILDVTFSAAGQSWTADDIGRIALERVLGSSTTPAPPGTVMPEPLDWPAILDRAGGLPQLFEVLAGLLVTERAVGYGIVARIQLVETRIVGPPRSIDLRVRGSRPTGYRMEAPPLEVITRVRMA